MSKTVKEAITNILRDRYSGVDSACVVNLSGMNVQAQESLRGKLRERSARLEVVKNSMARRAFADGPLEPLGTSMTGPCALVTGGDSIVSIAKLLTEAAKEFSDLKLKHAVLEGDPTVFTVEELSKMRGRVEIIGELAVLITSPGRAIAGCLKSPQSKIAGCLKAIVDRAAEAA